MRIVIAKMNGLWDLIINDPNTRTDRYVAATESLNERLQEIMIKRIRLAQSKNFLLCWYRLRAGDDILAQLPPEIAIRIAKEVVAPPYE